MTLHSLPVRRFRSIAAIKSSSFRGKPAAIAAFSSSSVVNGVDSTSSPHKRISLALYRQLLRWCDETDKNIPLWQAIPPIHFSPPQINADSLSEMLQSSGETNDCFRVFSPETSEISKAGITVHAVPTSDDAKQIVKAIFRMNAATKGEQDRKEQVSLAFEWIKTLNEMTQQLEEMKGKRSIRKNRDGVKFRVGQVVKHKTLAWRGVIIGWRRNKKDDGTDATGGDGAPRATSLTKKPYESIDPYGNEDDDIAYDVAIDLGDATLLSSAMQQSGLRNVVQSDLILVDDPDLMRIRTATDHFQRFDPVSLCFVPGDALAYVYPNDRPEDEDSWESCENPSDESAKNISKGIQSLAEYLRQIILGYTSAPEYRNLRLVSGYLERLTKLSKGDVIPAEDRFRGTLSSHKNSESAKVQANVKWELQKFVELAVEIEDIVWTRRNALETDRTIKFSLGEYVQHKKYGFRGVVVGWDPEPVYEVTHWDGLQHIENPETYPFYHVIPDRGDTMVAFGAERPWRYVCEENLEFCLEGNRDLDIDLEPGWTADAENGKYQPPEELLLRHGGHLEDDGLTEKCLKEVKDVINSVFSSIRHEGSSSSSSEEIDNDLHTILQQLSTENMYDVMKHAEDPDTATVLSDTFKEIWKGHEDEDIRYKFDTGVNYLLTGKTSKALAIFGEVVDEDPTYAEAWNKAATSEFMIGNLDASMAAAQRTLEIVPKHFQALNGLGLVYNEKRELVHAKDNFRKSIRLDPWSPVAPRLSVCLETLKRWKDTSVLNFDQNDDGPEWKNPYTSS